MKRIIVVILVVALTLSVIPDIGTVNASAADKTGKTADVSSEADAGFVNVEVDTDVNTAEIIWMGDVERIAMNFYEDEYEGAFEDETPIYQKSVDVSPSTDNIVTTNIDLDDNMPDYFILEVLLQDDSGNNVCDPYMSNAYSEAIRSVSEKTADDYRHEGDRLVEMATDSGVNDGSFMVLADDVLRIEEDDGAENSGGVRVDLVQTNGGEYLCTLDNVGDELSQQLEDIEKDAPVFIIDKTYDEEETKTGYHMFTAYSASVDSRNDSAVIRGTMEEGVDENGNTDPGMLGSFLKTSNVTVSKDYSFPLDGFPIGTWGTVNMDIKGTLAVSFVVDTSWKGITASFSIINDIHCEDAEVDFDLPTATLDIPLGEVPIFVSGVVNFEFVVNLRFSGTVTGGVRFDFGMRSGIEIGTKLKLTGLDLFVNNKSTMPTSEFRGFTLQDSLFAGIAGGLSLNVFKVLGVSAELESGFVFSGKLTSGHYWDGERKYHACKDFTCIDGDISYKILGYSVGVSAKIFSKSISGDMLPTVQIKPFYYSGTYKDSNTTNCPHWGYRLSVNIKNQNNEAIKDAEVSYEIDDKQFEALKSGKTNAEGTAKLYLPEGEHKINVSVKDETGHTYRKTVEFKEEGYGDDGKLVKETLDVVIDMSRYKLSFIDLDQSGKTENMPGQMYTYADEPEATIPEIEPKKTGRVFIGWAAEPGSSEVKYEPGDKITVKQDTQLYAVWDYDKYTIRFEPNKPGNASHDVDGEMNDETVGYSEYSKGGNKDIENRYSLTGWTFTGWSTVPYAVEAEYKDSIPYEAIRKSTTDTVTLYAQWEPKRYTVTFKDEDNDTEIGKPQNIYYDTPTSLRAFESFGVTKDNEVFTHWSTLGFGSNYADRANVTNLCTVDGDGNLEGYTLYANWFETDGATIVITNNGEMVNTSEPEKDIVLIDSKGDEFTGAVSGTNGVYAVNGEDSGALPKGTYTVEFRGSLADYDTDGRAIEVDEYAGVYNFDYYTVEISADGEGKAWIAGEDQSQLEKAEKLLRGTEIKINAAAEKGYHFEQYTILGAVDDTEWDSDAAEQTITVTGEMNIDAHFAANTYRVVFNANDGETEWTVTQDMVYDQQQKLFANQFLRTGYKFIGWTKTAEWPGPTLRDYTDSEEVVNLTSENGGRFDLYAQWSPAATFIEFDKNVDEGENVEGEMSLLKTFYDMETKLSSCEFTRNYWDFTGWNTESDGSGISYPDGSNFVSDNAVDNSTLTLYAQWKPTEYTIAYDLAGGIVLGENPEAYNITTEDFTVKNPERVGYIFLGWTGSNGNEPEKNVTIKKGSHGTRNYTANWKPEVKTISFDPAGGQWEDGKTAAVTEKADYDSYIMLHDAPSRDYYIFKWWEDSNGNNFVPGHQYKVTKNQEFKALWEPIEYSIIYELDGGFVPDDANPIVYTTETEDFTLVNPEKDGYVFLGWTGSDGDEPEKKVTIKKGSLDNRTYTANWEPIEYSITYELDGGFVPDDSNPVVYTTETEDFTLVNPEKDDYVFLGWTGSNGDEPEKKVTIKKGSLDNRTYTANWEQMKTTKPEDKTKGTKGKGTPTGDGFNPLLWAILLLSSAVALAALHLRKQ